MTGISNNPARVLLLTEMAEQTDGGAEVWEAQPASRTGTKNALLRDGFVTIAKGGKASITQKGREAVTACTLKSMTSPVALKAKAKFEAARAGTVKPAKAPRPTKADLTAALQSEEFAAAVAAQPAAIPAEVITEPVPEVQAPEAPAEEVQAKPTLGLGYKLAAILRDIYGVSLSEAPALAVIWAASQLVEIDGVEVAKAELAEVNKFREQAGKAPAFPPYGSILF